MNNAEYSGRPVDRAGVNPRSLLLLGGLAALALNADTRRKLVGGTRGLIDTAGHTLEDTVKPALATAADQAGHAAQVAVQKGAGAIGALREEVPHRTHALLETVQEAAGQMTETASGKAGELTRDAAQVVGGASRQASRELHKARKTGQGLLSDVGDRVTSLVGAGQDALESHRRDAERQLARARREAERELRSARRSWDAAKLERAVEKRTAPLRKRTARELTRLEREARRGNSGGGLGGTLLLALLGTGAVVLARVPAARQGVLKAVESVSPEAAERLHRASRNARNVIGSVWLERIEEVDQTPAPGTARNTQGGTTGAVWGSSPEAGSPAASSTTPTPEAQARAADRAEAGQAGAGPTGAGQTGAEQPKAGPDQADAPQVKSESPGGNKSN